RRLFEAGLSDVDRIDRVLLVGIGTGADLPFLGDLSHSVSPNRETDTTSTSACRIIGIDVSRPMLRRARQRAAQLNMDLTAVEADAGRLPVADGSCDIIVLTLILSVVTDPQAVLREAVRMLKPAGRLLVLDKFLPENQPPSCLRTLLNLVTRPFGTDINRRWSEMTARVPVAIRSDEEVGWGGSLRIIIAGHSSSEPDTPPAEPHSLPV
ncbi:MAG: methyltransferase domain-containing protein, partial [Planctomycetaceae bacterium]|nr:methyltransferase domain-containing protein [Planctomycetaceae bacterium]